MSYSVLKAVSNKAAMAALMLLAMMSGVMAAGPDLGDVERQPLNITAIALFGLFVVVTLFISYWASKRTSSSSDFYTGGGKITGLQNGTAIAGDFMSAASFLGVSSLIYAFGFDGLIFGLGAVAGWPMLLFLLSERVRNLGKYTFTDVVAIRLEKMRTRIISVLGSVTVVIFYLIAQMVGAGKLIELLFGLPYEIAVVIVSLLVIAYVAFGGMLATTWVQIVKAVMLLFGITLMAILVLYQVDFNFATLLAQATQAHPAGNDLLKPGRLYDDPIQVATILATMMFGILGLPHILMRLFTVPNAHESRRSALYASLFIGYFYLLLVVVGFGIVVHVLNNQQFMDASGGLIGGNNMAAIHLANALGGSLLMGFMSAVAFATILAVVAGLTVAGAAAIAHDLYAEVLHKGKPDPQKEIRLTRIVTVLLGLVAVALGILFQDQNIAIIAALPMVVAASVNFPILIMSIYWGPMTTRGAIAGALVGFVSSITLICVSPKVWVDVLGFEQALFPYDYPALFTMPLSFIAIWLFSVTDNSTRGKTDRAGYAEMLVQAELGHIDR
ncbi:cation/acetate symporter ActP [Dasania sp. GY-MA-18]|uniref:Cation/acetate symporter ActP n=1 Tax=Dasania phycosphaerae TaxID=2950436 RepID=A0A9J6RIW0_9GAMM|nr:MULTISPECIES: cation/acetate symporter ActP [Dasania]MCR8921886.1 cation/acetate symporter ActP [Dasania sp. GY-MA-18]MCZ0864314.1 cation/acetate symporter ActP [Dasania phycosphaerae]MCZ0868042.1 cation/acetate symporter ActP [Dasania phycosphaerae]